MTCSNQNKGRRLILNMATTFVSFVVSFGISFFLTPFITETLGAEAYGFISLGNNFINYAKIITSALNALAARFVAVAIYEEKNDEATRYFSSVLIANIIMSAVLSIPTALIIIYLPNFVDIQAGIINETRLLWLFLFASFFLTLITSIFGVATFLRNRVDLGAYRDIANNIIRAILLIAMFVLLPPKSWYYGLATLIAAIYLSFANYGLKKKLAPELQVKRVAFSFEKVKILLRAGVWSSINSLSLTMIEGLDLLISNLFIGSTAMGVLAIAKTVPSAISAMVSAMRNVFVPSFTKAYASNDEDFVYEIIRSLKIMGMLSLFPIVILIVLGAPFFTLWVPKQDARILYILALLTAGNLIINSTIQPIYGVYTAINRPKGEAISTLIMGFLNVVIVFGSLVLLPDNIINEPTNPWGLYVIAGVSSVLGILRALTFTPIYVARCLNVKRSTFYPAIIRSLLATCVTSVCSFFAISFMQVDTWLKFIIAAVIVCAIVLVTGSFVIFGYRQQKYFITKVKEKLDSR